MSQVVQPVREIDSLLGQVWGADGRYRLDSLLGRGNRASVYLATDLTTDQTVGIRVLDPELCTNATLVDRFLASVAAAATIQHSNILPILDHGTHDGMAYVVRPYVTGGTLRDRLGQPMPLAELVTLLRPIANALGHAHRLGFVHGDLKPGNILLLAGAQPLLADLGMAQALATVNSIHATTKGIHFGTPEYISPEQGQGNAFDARADLYALGVILYEALVGHPPFQTSRASDNAREIVMAHLTEPPPPPSSLNPAIGPMVEQVLQRALAKRPDDRYQTAVALLTALETAGATDRIAGFALDELAQQQARAATASPQEAAIAPILLDIPLPPPSRRGSTQTSLWQMLLPFALVFLLIAAVALFLALGR